MKNITKKSQYLMIVAGLLLLVLFFTPLWIIILEAPQYPDGLRLYIWIDQITGDLKNINIMNHYVGMKYIDPDAIPELSFFPYIIAACSFFAILFGYLGKKKLYLTWFIVMLVLGVLGLYDFYLWEYDYGHNLSDLAAIKIEGMAFQPPLLGSKQLLNFTAISLPAAGAYFIGTSVVLSLVSYFIKEK